MDKENCYVAKVSGLGGSKREKKCFTAMYSFNSVNILVLPLKDTFESLRYV